MMLLALLKHTYCIERIQMKCFIPRGIPGSGKSTLSRHLAAKYSAKICSADDFHIWWGNGTYDWQGKNTAAAHSMCRTKFVASCNFPTNVIVDNTNVKLKDIEFYLECAFDKNFEIYILEPDTDWKYNIDICSKINTHNVPKETIEKMLDSLIDSKKKNLELANKFGVKFEI